MASLKAFLLLLAVSLAILPIQAAASSNKKHSSFSLTTIPSLLHSLLSRVANHRLARGDVQGANRARRMSEVVGGGLQFWRRAGAMGWDYLLHYSWKHWNPSDFAFTLRLMAQLQALIGEVTHLRSPSDRVLWVSANYDRFLQIAKSILHKLLEFFNRSGALQEFLLAIQKEVINGEFLRDAMEIGGADLQGLIQVVKDVLQSQFGSQTSSAYSDL